MDLILDNFDVFVDGFWTTVKLSALSYLFAFLIGLLLASCRVGPVPPLRWAGTFYVETVRNTPLLVLLVLAYFGLPKLGFTWSSFTTAVIVISVYTGAFVGEAIRAGVNTVGTGQVEAARSIGLTFPQTLTVVVMPQALRSVVQPLGSLFSAMVRNTSLASVIAVPDLVFNAQVLGNETARYLPAFLGIFVAYFVITLPAAVVFALIERRVGIKR